MLFLLTLAHEPNQEHHFAGNGNHTYWYREPYYERNLSPK